MGYGELDFSHCRKAPQGSVHYFSTVGGQAAAERLRARAFPIVSHRATVGSGCTCTPPAASPAPSPPAPSPPAPSPPPRLLHA